MTTARDEILARLKRCMPFEVRADDAYGFGRRDAINMAIEIVETFMPEEDR